MYTTEISLLVIIVILLISNYLYQSEPEQLKVPTEYTEQINCQDCSSAKAKCLACPVDCYECANCAPNCDLCNTDCQKCKTSSCQPSCDKCLSSPCQPSCDKCSKSCPLDCSRLLDCPLPFDECKIVGEGLSFDLVNYATYNRALRVYDVVMKVITKSMKGHLMTLVNSNNIISLYVMNLFVRLHMIINKKKTTFTSWGLGKLQISTPGEITLSLQETQIVFSVMGMQYSVPVSNLDISETFSVHFGGVPGSLLDRAHSETDAYTGFTGCLTNLVINSLLRMPQEFMLRGAQVGCPRKFLPPTRSVK